MFRTAILRSSAAAVARTAMRPAATRLAAAPRIQSSFVAAPKSLVFQALRCYSSAGGLEKTEVYERIKQILTGFDKVTDPTKITETSHFANDLGLDSLDTVEVVMAIEEEFSVEIPDKDADTIHSIDKAVEYITSQPGAN